MNTKTHANLQLLEAAIGFQRSEPKDDSVGLFGVGHLNTATAPPFAHPTGVDIDRFSPKKRDPDIWRFFGIETSPVVIFVGQLVEEMNVDLLIDAFQLIQSRGVEASLAIVGEGPCLEALQSRSHSDTIHFLGDHRGEILAKLISSADILVYPGSSQTHGRRVQEAQAAGVAAIVSTQGPQSRIAAGRTGFVVPSGDVETLAFAIAKLCLDDNLRTAYGAAGRTRALSMTVDDTAAAYFA